MISVDFASSASIAEVILNLFTLKPDNSFGYKYITKRTEITIKLKYFSILKSSIGMPNKSMFFKNGI